jgi:hypothetical protein
MHLTTRFLEAVALAPQVPDFHLADARPCGRETSVTFGLHRVRTFVLDLGLCASSSLRSKPLPEGLQLLSNRAFYRADSGHRIFSKNTHLLLKRRLRLAATLFW